MKSIVLILKNIKNLFPYFLLIALYFFFINLETKKNQNKIKNLKEINELSNIKLNEIEKPLKIRIQVIPYKK